MNPKNKKVLAGALAAGVLVTWVPQLLSAGGEQPEPTQLAPALSTSVEGSRAGVGEVTPDATTPTATVGSPAAETALDPSAALDRRLGAVKAFLPERSQRDLDVLAAAWALDIEGQKPGKPAADGASEGEVDPGQRPASAERRVTPEEEREAPPPDPFESFLASHPLTGVLYGEEQRLANLGPLVVRPGDEIAGLARVVEIGPRWIVLEHGSRRVRIDIEPLRPRPAIAAKPSGSGSVPSSGGPSGPGVVPSTTGSTAGATVASGALPTAPSAEALGQMLGELQKALGAAAPATSGAAKASDEKGKKP